MLTKAAPATSYPSSILIRDGKRETSDWPTSYPEFGKIESHIHRIDIEIWRYPSGNKEAEAAASKAATERIGNGRLIVLVPMIPGEKAATGVQWIENCRVISQ